MEFEAKGPSDCVIGALAGDPTTAGASTAGTVAYWVGCEIRNNRRRDNVDNNRIDYVIGGSLAALQNRGPFWETQPNTWYRFKMIKSGANLYWEINNQIVNSINGASIGNGLTAAYLGFYTNAGMSAEFRNFRISQLDDAIDNVLLEPGSQAQSMISRVLPEGFATNDRLGNVEIFRIGDNRGEHTVGLSDYIITDSQALSNIQGDKYIINKNSDTIKIVNSNNSRVQRQADSGRISLVYSDLSNDNMLSVANAEMILGNKDINTVGLGIVNRPSLEQYDIVNLVNPYLGISNKFTVFNMNKNFNSSNGQFTEQLQLSPYEQ